MHINIFEWWLVLTNVPFLIVSLVFAYKRYYLISLLYVGLTIASSEYHICFSPVHVTSDRWLNFYNLCIITNSSVFGMSIMFVDILFANACFIYTFVLVLPIFTRNSMPLRYFIATLCIVVIFFIGVLVGFFPAVNNPILSVPETAELLKPETMLKLKKSHILKGVVKLIIVLSKLNKATYISIITLIFFVGFYVLFFFVYWSDISVKDNFTTKQKISIKIQIVAKELVEYYKRRFHIGYLISSSLFVFLAIVLWGIVEKMYHEYYMRTHGFWHLLSANSSILLGFSLKHKNNYRL